MDGNIGVSKQREAVLSLVSTWYEGQHDRVLEKIARADIVNLFIPAGDILAAYHGRGAYDMLVCFLGELREPIEADAFLDQLITKYPKCRHGLLVMASRKLEAGLVHDAIKLTKRSLVIHSLDLLAERILYDAYRQLPPSEQPPELKAANTDFKNRFCDQPFRSVFTNPDGNCFICCASYLPVPVGNMFKSGVDEIWNSGVAQELRRSIIDGDFTYCSKQCCTKIQAGTLPTVKEAVTTLQKQKDAGDVVAGGVLESLLNKETKLPYGPSFIQATHDKSCNLSCPSCRTQMIVANATERSRLDVALENVVLPMLKNAQRIWVTGSGDPFASKHFRDLLSRLNKADFPYLNVDIGTNGVLFTRREWEGLQGIHNMVDGVYISIDAANEETYAIIRRGGDFKRLLENLEFISTLRKAGKVKHYGLKFLVQALNFREMPDFVEMGRKYDVDYVSFQRLKQWGTFTPDEFAKHDIFDPANPDYDEFMDVLRDPVLLDSKVLMGNVMSFHGTAMKRRKLEDSVVQCLEA